MMTISRTYTDDIHDTTDDPRTRTGGPNRPRRKTTKRPDFYERFVSRSATGSHMPLDIELHWDWNNPLNIIPALALLLILIALVALIVA